jgi:hypothetical protein
MWIAKYNLCAHVYQFINEEKATFKHFLMYQHTALSLGGHYQEYTQQVWGKSWPWGISHRHDGTINECVD